MSWIENEGRYLSGSCYCVIESCSCISSPPVYLILTDNHVQQSCMLFPIKKEVLLTYRHFIKDFLLFIQITECVQLFMDTENETG